MGTDNEALDSANAPRLAWTKEDDRYEVEVGGARLLVHPENGIAFVDGAPHAVPYGVHEALLAAESIARRAFVEREAAAAAGLAALNGMGPWQRDAKVTLCDDAEGKRPRRVATIGRLVRNGFRLVGSGEWYGFDGKKTHGLGPAFVRPYRDGDEGAIREETARLRLENERAARVDRLKRDRYEVERQCAMRMPWQTRAKLDEHERAARDIRKTLAEHEARQAEAAAKVAEIDAEIAALTGGAT